MYKKIKILIIAVFVLAFTSVSMAQLTEPGDGLGGNPNDDPGGGVVGGGAPIGSGLAIFVALSAAYVGRKRLLVSESENNL